MAACQSCGCLSAIVVAVLLTECLVTSVTGDGADSEEPLDIKYVLIGLGLGLLLAALFVVVKICIIRKHVHDNSTECGMKRTSET
ncbi:transmembrane protein 273 isoform X2 [Anabas testudineus]|uniref:transmembrane protein 273 isoform X2 n=1 Tax=Anabas testudineus TaxID=64144 RepID=UPI000E461962|nr:transmembrane protein 273 isoform X2 [Anabas testudineus]